MVIDHGQLAFRADSESERLNTARPIEQMIDVFMAVKHRIVIFGGSGYVGGAVSEFMRDQFEIVVADVRAPNALNGREFIECDVRDSAQVTKACSGASAALYFSVIQIPQINAEKRLGYEVNVIGLQNVCETAMKTGSIKGVI